MKAPVQRTVTHSRERAAATVYALVFERFLDGRDPAELTEDDVLRPSRRLSDGARYDAKVVDSRRSALLLWWSLRKEGLTEPRWIR